MKELSALNTDSESRSETTTENTHPARSERTVGNPPESGPVSSTTSEPKIQFNSAAATTQTPKASVLTAAMIPVGLRAAQKATTKSRPTEASSVFYALPIIDVVMV